jgi:predicted phosphodiesterase
MKSYNTGIIMDTHHPFVHRKNYNLMLKVFDEAHLDEIVIIGDFGDFYFCNGHGKDPEITEKWSPKKEIASVRKELSRLVDRYPGVRIVFIEGNHEYRLSRYLKNKAPELFGLVDWKELLDPGGYLVDEFVDYGPEQLYFLAEGYSKLAARHEPLAGGMYPALNTVKRSNCSLVFGHTHSSQQAQIRLFDGSHHAAGTFGFLGDRDHPAFNYVKTKPTWTDGFALCSTDLKTGEFFLEGVTIINGRCKANGKIYS